MTRAHRSWILAPAFVSILAGLATTAVLVAPPRAATILLAGSILAALLAMRAVAVTGEAKERLAP